MNLTSDVVEGCLRSTICRIREVPVLHIAQACCRCAHGDELGRFGLIHKRKRGLEEEDDSNNVGAEMVMDIG